MLICPQGHTKDWFSSKKREKGDPETMKTERKVLVDGVLYPVILSDEQETLLAAKAAGRVFVGLAEKGGAARLWGAEYVAEAEPEKESGNNQEDAGRGASGRFLGEEQAAEDLIRRAGIDDAYLERVVRRSLGLPWRICETERLLIREFTREDGARVFKEPEEETESDRVFYTPELLDAYIRHQYRFCEYGIWAVVRKSDGALVGTAGVSAGQEEDGQKSAGEAAGEEEEWLELGYHIFRPYRRRGYAREACEAVIAYAEQELSCRIRAAVKPDNIVSVRLLKKLGIPYYFVTEGSKI